MIRVRSTDWSMYLEMLGRRVVLVGLLKVGLRLLDL